MTILLCIHCQFKFQRKKTINIYGKTDRWTTSFSQHILLQNHLTSFHGLIRTKIFFKIKCVIVFAALYAVADTCISSKRQLTPETLTLKYANTKPATEIKLQNKLVNWLKHIHLKSALLILFDENTATMVQMLDNISDADDFHPEGALTCQLLELINISFITKKVEDCVFKNENL